MRIFTFAASLLACVWATAVAAQNVAVIPSDPLEEVQPAGQKEQPVRISTAYAHRFETDLDKNGKFSTDTLRLEVSTISPLARALTWDNLIFYTYDYYDFSGTRRGGWWKDIHNLTFVPSLRWQIDRHWSVFGGPVLLVGAESGADFGDGVSGGGLVGFVWTRDANLSIGAGIAGVTHIEDKFGLAPIPLARWRFADGWTLRAGVPDFGARRGFGAEIGWGTATMEISGGAQYQNRRFRLDDDGPATQADGVGEERSVPVYGKLTFKAKTGTEIDLFAGVALAGQLKIEDEDGHRVSEPGFDHKQEFDAAPILGTRLRFLF